MIEVDSKYYAIEPNDKFELNDDFFELICQVSFFPDAKTINFFTEQDANQMKFHYQEFIKNLKSIKKFKRENIDLII